MRVSRRFSRVAVVSQKAAQVTRQRFDYGFGLALNNPVIPAGPWFFPGKLPAISVKVLQGPGWVLADNDARKLIVPTGGNIRFRRSPLTARFVALR